MKTPAIPARLDYLDYVAAFIAEHGYLAANDGNAVEFVIEVYDAATLQPVDWERHHVTNMREARTALGY